MIKFLKNFRKDEDGAVTVDWVVLTAGIIGLGIAVFSVLETQTREIAGEAAANLQGEFGAHTDDIQPGAASTTTN